MYKPARKIVNTRSRKNIGFFPSRKNERLVAFESLIERDYIFLLEYDRDVICYKEQPLEITYRDNNRRRKCYPDFEVQRKGRKQLIEVKPHAKLVEILHDETTINKFNAVALYCDANGYSNFKIVTDKDIRAGNALKNISLLFSYSNIIVPKDIRNAIINVMVLSDQDQTINQLLSKICAKENTPTIYAYILNMLYYQEISTNLEESITRNSLIYLNN
jgi:hypothetical protein